MTQDPESTALSDLLAELRGQTAWLRAMALPVIRSTLESAIRSDAERVAFEASDGSRSGQEIKSLVNVSAATVSGWWKKWKALGVAFEVSPRRTAHVISLTDLGLDVPEISPPESASHPDGPPADA